MTNTKDIISSLTANIKNTGSIPVAIPSNGQLYGSNFKGVTLRALTLEDEKFALQAQKAGKNPVNSLLQRCLGGVDVDDLLPIDRDSLIISLRELSFGDEFKAIVPCPKCEADNNLSFQLSKLPAEPLPEGFVEPVEVNLKDSKLVLELRFPRVSDEKFLQEDLAADSLWRFVSTVSLENSDEKHTDKEIISGVISQLPIADLHRIVQGINLSKYGIQPSVKIKCQYCSKLSVIELPINSDFFTVTS